MQVGIVTKAKKSKPKKPRGRPETRLKIDDPAEAIRRLLRTTKKPKQPKDRE
jgi:hypothetical protein